MQRFIVISIFYLCFILLLTVSISLYSIFAHAFTEGESSFQIVTNTEESAMMGIATAALKLLDKFVDLVADLPSLIQTLIFLVFSIGVAIGALIIQFFVVGFYWLIADGIGMLFVTLRKLSTSIYDN